jgi:hypothetical protein
MREEILEALEYEFKSRQDKVKYHLEPPDYLSESVSEYQDDYWDQLDDHHKFKWTKNNTDLLDDESTFTPEIIDIKRPAKIDPLGDDSKHGRKTIDYKMTQALARKMSLKRAKEIFKQRGIETKGSAGDAIREIDNTLWSSWKSSSTSPHGKLLQLAIAEELHGRLNYKQLGDAADILLLRKKVSKDFDGGYEAIKAYLRAKWETTQWLLDNAGMQTLNLYRGLRNLGEKESPGSNRMLTTARTATVCAWPAMNAAATRSLSGRGCDFTMWGIFIVIVGFLCVCCIYVG